MQRFNSSPGGACGPSVSPNNGEAKSGVKEGEKLPQEEKMEQSQTEILTLRRNFAGLGFDFQNAADAKESTQRQIEELRLRQSEGSCRGQSEIKQREVPAGQQEAPDGQEQSSKPFTERQKERTNKRQQFLKCADESVLDDLMKQRTECDVVMERTVAQIKILGKAYREEEVHMMKFYLKEIEILLIKGKTEIDRCMKEHLEKQLVWVNKRNKELEKYEARIQGLSYKPVRFSGRPHTIATEALLREKPDYLNEAKNSVVRQKKVIRERLMAIKNQEEQFTKSSQSLSRDHKHKIEQYERVQKTLKNFTATHSRKFKDMWLMLEDELKQKVETVLELDSRIYKHLGVPWERPHMPFLENSGSVQPKKQARRPGGQAVSQSFQTGQTLQQSQQRMDASVGPRLETDSESKDEREVESHSDAESKEGRRETAKKVMELLCDEAGFLIDEKLVKLLAPLEKEEQNIVKCRSLLSSLGFEEEDLPLFVNILIQDKYQQLEQTEDVESGECSGEAEEEVINFMSELMHPNLVVPALKKFLEQLKMSRESSAHQHPSWHMKPLDRAEHKAYWESMANIISEDKLKLWDAAGETYKEYLAVLKDISHLIPETKRLERENQELRMALQQFSV